MNLKYKELAEQAWNSVRDEIGDVYREDGINWDFLHAYDKRYAELIVKECAEVARAHTLEKYHGVIGGYYGIVYVEEAIKQHFGVKQHDQSGTY